MAPPIRPIADRIKERVTISDRGCWLWNGPIFKDGYGAIGIKRTGQHRAHRVSFATFVSPIPAGMWVLHRCDTPSCVNPEHLFLGSARDNALDREAKGRANRAHGASHHWAKHTARFVWAVRKLHKFGVSVQQLADLYREPYGSMHQLCKGKGWKAIDSKAIQARVLADWRQP